jgi:hypothetical protein
MPLASLPPCTAAPAVAKTHLHHIAGVWRVQECDALLAGDVQVSIAGGDGVDWDQGGYFSLPYSLLPVRSSSSISSGEFMSAAIDVMVPDLSLPCVRGLLHQREGGFQTNGCRHSCVDQ